MIAPVFVLRAALMMVLLGCFLGCSGAERDPDPDPSVPPEPVMVRTPVAVVSDPPELAVPLVPNRLCAPNLLSPAVGAEASWEAVFPNVRLQAPTAMTRCGDAEPWLALEIAGVIRAFDNEPDARPRVVLDHTEEILSRFDFQSSHWETGLLGIACAPDYAESRTIYFTYTTEPAAPETQEVALNLVRAPIRSDGTIDPDSIEVLWSLDFPTEFHHAGGIAFDAEGRLFLSIGEGLRPEAAQDPTNPYGSIVRFDADMQSFEVFAYGLRNPWTFSIDPALGHLWVADVGHRRWEEVNRVVRGGNYGWGFFEGFECIEASCPPESDFDFPVLAYPNRDQSSDENINGDAVVMGFVYRGADFPALTGRLVFGDLSGKIWALDFADGEPFQDLITSHPTALISALVEGPGYEVLALDYRNGQILALRPGQEVGSDQPPIDRISSLSCFGTRADQPPAPARNLLSYTINAPLWSDGATKRRWVVLPGFEAESEVDILADGTILLPPDSALVKEFALQDELLETRFFVKSSTGTWSAFTFKWEGADAVRIDEGLVQEAPPWVYPSQIECFACHNDPRRAELGLRIQQLAPTDESGSFYAWLRARRPEAIAAFEPWPRFDDTNASIDVRVRTYLASNCAHCHRPQQVVGRTGIDLRYLDEDGQVIPVEDMNLCGQASSTDYSGAQEGDLLIFPGDAERSIIFQRISATGADGHRMPPVGTEVPDARFRVLFEAWLDANPCAPP